MDTRVMPPAEYHAGAIYGLTRSRGPRLPDDLLAAHHPRPTGRNGRRGPNGESQ
jgi:hypothetical protein